MHSRRLNGTVHPVFSFFFLPRSFWNPRDLFPKSTLSAGRLFLFPLSSLLGAILTRRSRTFFEILSLSFSFFFLFSFPFFLMIFARPVTL